MRTIELPDVMARSMVNVTNSRRGRNGGQVQELRRQLCKVWIQCGMESTSLCFTHMSR